MRTLLALMLMCASALAQNSFPTAGGQTVQGRVAMCMTGGQAKPCSGTVTAGPDAQFPTAGGATVGSVVWMCLVGGKAVPC